MRMKMLIIMALCAILIPTTASTAIIVKQPEAAKVVEGDSASYMVVARGDNLRYQWQKRLPGATEFIDIEGATRDVYVTPPAELAQSHTRYRCVVTGEAGSQISASVNFLVRKRVASQEDFAVNITVGTQVFTAKFYGNEASRALMAQMPFTVNMTDLNRNEKYYNLPENLPSDNTEKPETIHAGEIMCWSGDTLVLFYETFSNAYGGYVRLGTIEDTTGLAAALGTDNVTVTFSK